MNQRNKGLSFVREVKSILQYLGHETEGPGYLIITVPRDIDFNGVTRRILTPVQTHKDYFGAFDLISWDPKVKKFAFHQVSTDDKRSQKIKAILAKGMAGNVWGRTKDGHRVMYRTYFVSKEGEVTEGETYYLPKKEVRENDTQSTD